MAFIVCQIFWCFIWLIFDSIVYLFVFFVFAFVIFLGFYLSICTPPQFIFFSTACSLLSLGSQGEGWAQAQSGVGVLSQECWTAREFLAVGNINWQVLSKKSPSQL